MQRDEIYAALRKLIPMALLPFAYVAGGYAHSEEKAGDIDVWVVGQEDMQQAEETIRVHLMDKGYLAQGSPLFRGPSDNGPEYDAHPHGFKPAAFLYEPSDATAGVYKPAATHGTGKPVQILVTRQPTIQALLGVFDISTHMIGRSLEHPTLFYAAPHYFPLGAQPRVVNFDTPATTLQRLEKICLRYGHMPHPDDVEMLQGLIAAAVSPEAPAWEEVTL